MRQVELLAPAGDLHRLKTAIDYGADAVYIGGKSFSLRARASNFDIDDIKEAVMYAHDHGAKVYVTVNMIPHQEDLEGLSDYLKVLESIQVDAIIVASLHVVTLAKQVTDHLEIHLSTQLSSTNAHALRFYKKVGVDRVVLARECSLTDIKQITSQDILPTEVFIHGGMCVNISGRCTLSNHMTFRDANRGGCAQSCRWKYECYDQNMQPLHAPDILFSMSSKDLNATTVISDLMQANVCSLKIEGRMKSEYYLATVVGAYRKLIDGMRNNKDDDLISVTNIELSKAENRATFSGFYHQVPDHHGHLYGVNGAGVTQEFLGVIMEYDPLTQMATMQVRNHFETNMACEVFGPHHENEDFVMTKIINSDGEHVDRVYKPMEIVQIKIPFNVDPKDFIRKRST